MLENLLSNFVAYGATGTTKAHGYTGMLVTLVIWAAIFYLFIIRPNKKKKKKQQDMRDSLKAGKEVVTTGGIKGEVVSVNDELVVVRVDKGVRLTFTKDAIRVIL